MAFSSLSFILRFIPIFLIVYYLVKPRYRNAVLLIGSMVFYACGNPYYLVLLAFSVLVNYFYANRIYRLNEYDKENNVSNIAARRVWLICALIFNIALLLIFKYLGFGISIANSVANLSLAAPLLTLPLGISFYTFQMISFVVDVYRRKYEEKVSLFHFATYATMFPQITSGPITRYEIIERTLVSYRYANPAMLEQGITTFIVGLGYKVLLADKIASLWNDVWRVGALGIDPLTAWLGAIGYSFEIYFDFAGYSLMAIGVGNMLGFRLPTNFDNPYMVKSMTEFWRKWHITLGTWFRDYLYIPLGGNRKGQCRMYINLLIVWMLTGLWHGASYNFLVWGLFLFIVIAIEKTFLGELVEKSKVIGHIYMWLLIPVSWTIFNITDLQLLGEYLCRMFFVKLPGMVNNGYDKFVELISVYWWMILLCAFFCTPYPQKWLEKFGKSWLVKALLLIILWVCIYQLAQSGNNPFIYFSF
ncbi:MAG: MBOAT family protein [Lachnospiraceae bacterium]|nr:MBOAT family protein [Candidatus Colinaster equi]